MNEMLKVLDFYGIPYNQKIICPFHGDKNPSLQIDVDKDFWFCYGCQIGGTAYKFHKKMREQQGVKNELIILQEYNRIINGSKAKINVFVYKQEAIKKDKSYYRQCLKQAKDFYYGLKTVDWFDMENVEILEYMLYRGFTRSTLNRFGGKYTYKEDYPIIFPIMDNGHFKGWVSRTCDIELSHTRKYLYNKGFRRNSSLAGLYRNSKTVMLVEGYFDMLKARQLGIRKVAAILGWKITDKQIQKLKNNGVSTIISALDNDEKGHDGTKYLKKYFDVVNFPYPHTMKDMGDMDVKTLGLIQSKFKKLKEIK